MKLHELGALTDFLLPGSGSRKSKVSTTNGSTNNKHEGTVHSHVLIMPECW
jgi:endoribonuclease Dicer